MTDAVAAYVIAVIRRTRELPSVVARRQPSGGGASAGRRPRPSLASRAATSSRPTTSCSVAPDVLRHRLLLQPEAELERYRPDDAVRAAIAAVPVPAVSPRARP